MILSQEVLEIIPKITGGLSFLFSLLTVTYIIFFGDDAKRGFYNRLVIGMCCADMVSSLAFFFSTWPMPVDSSAVLAAGNEATCRIQGFFTQYSIASQLYVASIGAFYLLAIKYHWKEDHFAKWGPLFHLVPVGFGLGTSITVIILDIVGPANLWCWIAPQPDRPELDVNLYRMVLFYGPLWLAMFFVGVNLFFVFRYVNDVTKAAEGHVIDWMPENSRANLTKDVERHVEGEDIYCGQGSNESPEDEIDEEEYKDSHSTTSDEIDGRVSRIVRKKQEAQIKMYARRRREIAYQCLRFAFAFYITWTPLSCVRILQLIGHPVPYGLLVLSAVMTPIQGLPNLIAFLYPMIRKKWKRRRLALKNNADNNRSKANAVPKNAMASANTNPAPSVIDLKIKQKSDRQGIQGSSAWENSMMSQQHTYQFHLDSSELQSEEMKQSQIFLHPELLMMAKR